MRIALIVMFALLPQLRAELSLHSFPSASPFFDHNVLSASSFSSQDDSWYQAALKRLVQQATLQEGKWQLSGPDQAEAAFGASVASAGDLNGDGYTDVAIGAPLYDSVWQNEGRVFVYYGSASGLAVTPAITLSYHSNTDGNEHFGSSVAGAGDVNRDGYADLIVGASYASDDGYELAIGHALIYYGSPTGIHPTPNKLLKGTAPFAFYGTSVTGAGDINRDGYSDVVVGAPGYGYDEWGDNRQKGRVFLYYGSASGLTATAWIDGTKSFDDFGAIVAAAGDVNGDGFSDVLVSAPRYNVYNISGDGAVWLYLGAATGLQTASGQLMTDPLMYGSTGFGSSLAGGNDLNGDGFADLVIAQPHYLYVLPERPYGDIYHKGRLLVYYGNATGYATTPVVLDHTDSTGIGDGGAVANAGDVNGDGWADIVVAGHWYDSTVHAKKFGLLLYHGAAGGLTDTVYELLDTAGSEVAGLLPAAAGDVNGDGYADMVTGNPGYTSHGNTNAGTAYVFKGGPDPMTVLTPGITFESPGLTVAGFGKSLQTAGDINGDGFADVVIGDPNAIKGLSNYEGKAYVYYGSPTGLPATPSLTLQVNQPNCKFGWSVTGAGDVNGDGYADLLISALRYNETQGRLFLYKGSPGGLVTTPIIISTALSNSYLGFCTASAGDVNGDGYDDVLVSANNDGIVLDTGKVFLYYGMASGLPATPSVVLRPGSGGLVGFGRSLAGAGDINGDGYDDVVIGGSQTPDGSATQEQQVFVYYGAAAGLNTAPGNVLANTSEYKVYSSVAGPGDVDGDGFADVVVAIDSGQLLFHGSPTGLSNHDRLFVKGIVSGFPVAAGDVNSDGYADVLVAGKAYSGRGIVWIYKGTPDGLDPQPDSLQNYKGEYSNDFGYAVAGAGDVNGDGFPDVLVGELSATTFGAAYLFYGNGAKGRHNNLRLYNDNLSSPLSVSHYDDKKFGIGLFGSSFLGRQKGKLVWETRPAGEPFSGIPVTNSTERSGQQDDFSNLGLSGTELKSRVSKEGKVTYVRARLAYDPVTSITGQRFGPWRYPAGKVPGKSRHTRNPLEIWTFTAVKEGRDAALMWTTPGEAGGVRYTVERSGNGQQFVSLYTTLSRPGTGLYRWTDKHPLQGANYYRIRASKEKEVNYSVVRRLDFGGRPVCSLYPNPLTAGQLLHIKCSPSNGRIAVQLYDRENRMVWARFLSSGNEWFAASIPVLPPGAYHVVIKTEEWVVNQTLIISPR